MTRGRRVTGTVLVLVVAAGLGAGLAWAAFVGTTTNPGNTFTASSCFNNTQRTSTGSYVGDGVNGRAITAGFRPDLVMVKSNTGQIGVARTSTMTGDASKLMSGGTALSTNRIESITGTGFTVGNNAQVNSNGTGYQWVAIKAGCGLTVGSYTGNGAASRAITGVGFQPELAFVMSAGANQAMERFAGMTRSYAFSTGTGSTTAITSLDAGGFSVGNASETNTNNTVYHYAAFDDVAGSSLAGTYTGDAVDNRDITTVGFHPDYLMIRANDTGTSRSGHQRPGSLAGTASQFWAATGNSNNGIQALQATGFQVGTDASVNASGPTYHFMAFKNSAGGCGIAGETLNPTQDSYVDQGGPTTTFGTASTIRVRSRAGQNRRALVQFSLPAVPAGCSLVGASLRLWDETPYSGRVIEVHRNSAAWTEAAVNWNNQPGVTGTAVTATSPGNSAWMQWDVTDHVEAMYSGTNDGFGLRDQTEDGPNREQQFNSLDDGSDAPQLVLQFG